MRVKIKIGGVLHHTLTKMVVNDETRFSRLRSSSWSAWNMQRLLVYGLIKRTPTHRKGDPNAIEKHYDKLEKRSKGIVEVSKVPALDKALGIKKEKRTLRAAYTFIRPQKNPLTRGVESVKYTPTKQGERVLKELNECQTYYLTTVVSASSHWQRYFTNHVW